MDIAKQEGTKVQLAKKSIHVEQREAENNQAAIILFR